MSSSCRQASRRKKSLADELRAIHLTLCKVADVPYDDLDPHDKLWASEAREESYDMEDVLDRFLVSFDGGNNNHTPDANKPIVSRFLETMGNMLSGLSRFKARREIASTIEDIKTRVDEIADRRKRCKIDDVVANSTTRTRIDPRVLMALGTKASDLVGMDKQSDALDERRVVYDIDNPAMHPGALYASMVDFRIAMRQYAINNEFELGIEATNKSRYRGYCKGGDCPWTISAIVEVQGSQTVKVTKMNDEQTCTSSGKRLTSTQTSNWVAAKARPLLLKKPHMGAKELQTTLQKLVPSCSFWIL